LLIMSANAPERGGPFGPGNRERPTFRGAESSPLGGWRVALSFALGAAAIVAIGCAVAILAKAHVGQALLEVSWKRAQQRGTAPAPWPWADTRPVAKLMAPRQQVARLVLAGANGRTLAWGPGVADGTARPGERGNAVVTAHRDTHFTFLADVAVGDPLIVERVDGVRVAYRVVSTRIDDASSLRIPRDVDVPTLTLVTCWPFGAVNPGGTLRYVVVAEATGRPGRAML
jgi:sortase A